MYRGLITAGDNAATYCYDDHEMERWRTAERTVNKIVPNIGQPFADALAPSRGEANQGVQSLAGAGRGESSRELAVMVREAQSLAARLMEQQTRALRMTAG